jgi:hypothetical protein
MKFALTTFRQDGSFRVYSFTEKPRGKEYVTYLVRADVDTARRWGISLQELPLLCCRALEDQVPTGELHTITFTPRDMQQYVAERALQQGNSGRKRYAQSPAGPPPPQG